MFQFGVLFPCIIVAVLAVDVMSMIVPHVLNAKPHNAVEYKAAPVEQYLLDNTVKLGYDRTDRNPLTCDFWKDPRVTTNAIHQKCL
jgi:hypothetical protein